jgi:cytochrome c oxidase assembly protein subunit 15
VLVLLAFLEAIRRRERRDLVWLSLWLLVGYVGEAVLGGITVLLKLAPELVAAHLVLVMLLLTDAVALHWRVSDGGARRQAGRLDMGAPSVGADVRLLGRLTLAVLGLVIILGTVATGGGPRAGSPKTPRFHLRFAVTHPNLHHRVLEAEPVHEDIGTRSCYFRRGFIRGRPARTRRYCAQLRAVMP